MSFFLWLRIKKDEDGETKLILNNILVSRSIKQHTTKPIKCIYNKSSGGLLPSYDQTWFQGSAYSRVASYYLLLWSGLEPVGTLLLSDWKSPAAGALARGWKSCCTCTLRGDEGPARGGGWWRAAWILGELVRRRAMRKEMWKRCMFCRVMRKKRILCYLSKTLRQIKVVGIYYGFIYMDMLLCIYGWLVHVLCCCCCTLVIVSACDHHNIFQNLRPLDLTPPPLWEMGSIILLFFFGTIRLSMVMMCISSSHQWWLRL